MLRCALILHIFLVANIKLINVMFIYITNCAMQHELKGAVALRFVANVWRYAA
jgi:hypothetical protein